MKSIFLLSALVCSFASAFSQDSADHTFTEIWKPVPPVVTPGKTSADAPSDAIVLFDGKDFSKWTAENGGAVQWTLGDGAMTVQPKGGGIKTRQGFGDCQMHIEFRTPAVVKGNGQGRGNSGIFLMGKYELQVLDNYNNITYSNGQAGSIYKQHIPAANVCRPPGEWQSYDIIFIAPKFYADGRLKTPATMTVLQNGVLVQHNAALIGATQYVGIARYEKHADSEPIMLQDHGDLVSYRNIWIRPL